MKESGKEEEMTEDNQKNQGKEDLEKEKQVLKQRILKCFSQVEKFQNVLPPESTFRYDDLIPGGARAGSGDRVHLFLMQELSKLPSELRTWL